MIARARATFPEAKRRFLAGLPAGYVLIVESEKTLIVVYKIESGEIQGRTVFAQQFVSPDKFRIHERELTEWGIVEESVAAEGNFSRLVRGTRVTPVGIGAGATCSQAQMALESLTRSQAMNACKEIPGSHLCGDEGVWPLGSCQRKARGKSYELKGFMYFGCCEPERRLWIPEVR